MRTIKGINIDLKDKWQRFTTIDGLADNRVHSILEDSSGNIWFGTYGGVSRYDGKGFENFTTKDGLADNNILSILADFYKSLLLRAIFLDIIWLMSYIVEK